MEIIEGFVRYMVIISLIVMVAYIVLDIFTYKKCVKEYRESTKRYKEAVEEYEQLVEEYKERTKILGEIIKEERY